MSRALLKSLFILIPALAQAVLLYFLYISNPISQESDFQLITWLIIVVANLFILFVAALGLVLSSHWRSEQQQKQIRSLKSDLEQARDQIGVLQQEISELKSRLQSENQALLEYEHASTALTELLAWLLNETYRPKLPEELLQKIRVLGDYCHLGLWEFDPTKANLHPLAFYDFDLKRFSQPPIISIEDHARAYHWLKNGNILIYNESNLQIQQRDYGKGFFDALSKGHSLLVVPAINGEQFLGVVTLSNSSFNYQWDNHARHQARFFAQMLVLLIQKIKMRQIFAHQRAERNAVLHLLDQSDNAIAKFDFRNPLLISDTLSFDNNIFSTAKIWYSNSHFLTLYNIRQPEDFDLSKIVEPDILEKLLASNFKPLHDTVEFSSVNYRRKIVADLNAGLFTGIWFHLTEITENVRLTSDNMNLRSQLDSYSQKIENLKAENIMLDKQLRQAQQFLAAEMLCTIGADGKIDFAMGFDEDVVGQPFVSLFSADSNLRSLMRQIQLQPLPAMVRVNYQSQDKLLIIRKNGEKISATLLPLPLNASSFYPESIFEFLPIGVVISDLHGKILYANQKAKQSLELDNGKGKAEAILEVVRVKLAQNRSYDNLVKVGQRILRVSSSRSAQNLIVLVQENTQQAESAARFYHTLLKAFPTPLAVVATDGKMIYANQAFKNRWPEADSLPDDVEFTHVDTEEGRLCVALSQNSLAEKLLEQGFELTRQLNQSWSDLRDWVLLHLEITKETDLDIKLLEINQLGQRIGIPAEVKIFDETLGKLTTLFALSKS